MAEKSLILNLGKLMIAVAWADGELTHEEVNALKELLFLLPDISGEEWLHLELYMESPVGEEERQRLLAEVLDEITSSADKALVLDALQKLVGTDGVEKEAERSMLDTLRQDIEGKMTGLLSHLSKPLRVALRTRAKHYQTGGRREDRLEDYIKNTIYYQLTTELQKRGTTLSVPESQVRKICLAAGLMARVAWVDDEFCDREKASITHALVDGWGLPEHEAQLIIKISHARIMKGLDSVRVSRGFCECTTIDERKAFLRCLFTIANATGKTSNTEIEEIRGIAKALELPHQDFIQAKLTIPREDCSGL